MSYFPFVSNFEIISLAPSFVQNLPTSAARAWLKKNEDVKIMDQQSVLLFWRPFLRHKFESLIGFFSPFLGSSCGSLHKWIHAIEALPI